MSLLLCNGYAIYALYDVTLVEQSLHLAILCAWFLIFMLHFQFFWNYILNRIFIYFFSITFAHLYITCFV